MKQLLWTETVKNDLQQIYNYIAENSIFYADKVIDEIYERVEMLETFPKMGRIVPPMQNEKYYEDIIEMGDYHEI